jgi:hypothetical protein
VAYAKNTVWTEPEEEQSPRVDRVGLPI